MQRHPAARCEATQMPLHQSQGVITQQTPACFRLMIHCETGRARSEAESPGSEAIHQEPEPFSRRKSVDLNHFLSATANRFILEGFMAPDAIIHQLKALSKAQPTFRGTSPPVDQSSLKH